MLIIDIGRNDNESLYVEFEDGTILNATNPEHEQMIFFDLIEEDVEIEDNELRDMLGTTIGFIAAGVIMWTLEYLEGLDG